MIERLEILASVCMKNRKFKSKAEERLDKLEAAQLNNVQKDKFESELSKLETRLSAHMREQFSKFASTMTEHRSYLDETIINFDK